MEQQEKIILRIDRRWKNAIEKHLKDETLQEHLEDVLDALCNQLPEQEYARISREILREDRAAREAAAAQQSYAAFHVVEQGREWYFKDSTGEEFLNTAARLRCYLRDADSRHGPLFVSSFPGGQSISPEEFHALADLRLENTGKVTGAFEINFDSWEFSALNSMDGWKSWALQAIADAAAEAYQNPEASDDDRWRIFLDQLDGQALRTPSRLTVQNFCFEDTIELMDDRLLNFVVIPRFDVDEAFGTFVETDENDHNLNVYANYDILRQEICDELEITLYGSEIEDQQLTYCLNAAEKEVLLRKMGEYCQEQEGMALREYAQWFQEELRQEPEMQM